MRGAPPAERDLATRAAGVPPSAGVGAATMGRRTERQAISLAESAGLAAAPMDWTNLSSYSAANGAGPAPSASATGASPPWAPQAGGRAGGIALSASATVPAPGVVSVEHRLLDLRQHGLDTRNLSQVSRPLLSGHRRRATSRQGRSRRGIGRGVTRPILRREHWRKGGRLVRRHPPDGQPVRNPSPQLHAALPNIRVFAFQSDLS